MLKLTRYFFLLLFIFSSPLSYARQTEKYDFIVAQDGSGNFKTVQDAIDAVPDMRKKTTTIFIKKGIYKEKLILAGSKQMVKFIGEDVDKTILTFDDWAQKKNRFGEEIGTSGSSSFFIYGDNFSAENITFQNSAGPVGQAVAVWSAGDKMMFKNCRFLGFQDTLYTFGRGSRQYYKNCYIEGTVDFIFGSSTAVFDNCELYCKKSGYVTAASTPDTTKYGYVFLNCKLSGDGADGSFFLGRPWRPFAKVVFINSTMSKVINLKGWDNWGKDSNEKTAYFAEYKNKGAGFKPEQRVQWSHQLSENELKEYTLENIFRGWIPY
ncbi:pectinesterase family protein [Desertivirga arenae]|uniref:pectinesterase family protein n=1 Tax=Desertivirga arenae TaxID=2810309 RepID=UPI001A95BC91|nr:pectinesterase family protein [Pedobacter sp. SYSU D00823]